MGIGALNKILLIVYHSPPDISLPSFCVFPGSRNPPFTFHAHHVTILVYSPQDLNAICGLCLRDYKVLHPTMFSKTFFFSKTQTVWMESRTSLRWHTLYYFHKYHFKITVCYFIHQFSETRPYISESLNGHDLWLKL